MTLLHRMPIALALAVACVFPFLVEGYHVYTATRLMALSIAIAGVTLLTGVAGLFSIGQSAFFALGAYTIGVAGEQIGIHPYVALPLAALTGGLLGFGFGWPAARLGAVHLALLTWGLAVSIPRLLKSTLLDRWTGGVQGIYLDRPVAPGWTGLNDDQWWWFLTLLIMIAVFWMLRNLIGSRMGRAMKAARDQPLAASSMGINVTYIRAMAFAISGAVTAVAGAITGILDEFIGPDAYSVFFSITLLVGAVAGGIGHLRGAIFGAVTLVLLKMVSDGLALYVTIPLYGFVLIGLIMLAPRGVSPVLDRAWASLTARIAGLSGRS
jgi:branched-chain amino acid transport system permease protein